MLYAIVGLLVVIVDQWVKYWVSGAINPESTGEAFIPGILSLVNVHNDGAAFSFLAGSNARIPFIIITGAFIVAVIIALATKFISGKFARWCLVLVTAGGLGNCIDRVIYGYVQDMFKCELFNFPIFNVADIFITVFAILFVLAVLFERRTVYDDYEDEFSLEDEEEDDYDDEEELRAARKARKAEKKQAKKARKAARAAEVDEEEEEEEEPARPARKSRKERPAKEEAAPSRPARKSRKERAEEAYFQAQAEADAARKRAEEAAAAAERKAAQAKAPAEDPFAEWERANARAGVQSPRRTARTQTAAPAAAAKPAAAPARPAASSAASSAKPQAPVKKPAPVAVEEDFSLDDILAEFK